MKRLNNYQFETFNYTILWLGDQTQIHVYFSMRSRLLQCNKCEPNTETVTVKVKLLIILIVSSLDQEKETSGFKDYMRYKYIIYMQVSLIIFPQSWNYPLLKALILLQFRLTQITHCYIYTVMFIIYCMGQNKLKVILK